eukprot:CAMPEP_0115044476 /NCGR_PEP_ID=MMETSP0216-20121206/47508_1 /TAXON_ID=223996 /ORGANISM="Protocruzia adherens, Strain Boccale" /LENGTH=47 /DNA_ID= /DNA_START= /DNA_END= /DNA_ORIENTATION=
MTTNHNQANAHPNQMTRGQISAFDPNSDNDGHNDPDATSFGGTLPRN